MRLDGRVNVPVDVVSGVPQDSVLCLLLFILYTPSYSALLGNICG